MIVLLRLGVIVIFTVSGYFFGQDVGGQMAGAAAGLGAGVLAVAMEFLLARAPAGSLVGAVAGLALGLLCAAMLWFPLRGFAADAPLVPFVLGGVLGYGGMLIGFRRGADLSISSLAGQIRGYEPGQANQKILDTSVIIDGRIADICETGFLEGTFIVPQFILQELQHIADSADSLKRARGRRGLDILHRMQKMADLNIEITDQDFPKIKEVDAKLVALGKAINAKVVTNDFNLNKVAELQGVHVLNINELANAIKPVVLPGELLKVFIVKEGKESGQGVAYLDDGTMVVVDNGKKLIGKNVSVTVTSVLQTTAGRMIFTKSKDD